MKFIFDQLTCPNCKQTEKIENMNTREDTKMFVADLYLQPKRDMDLKIYTFICFSCSHLTNCAGKINGDVEYFETYKFDSVQKLEAYYSGNNQYKSLAMYALNLGYNKIVKKFNKIKKVDSH
tara:strand:- start:99 stop:464 length:366 start_codon:yes stop_codon:yes gene_type:complete